MDATMDDEIKEFKIFCKENNLIITKERLSIFNKILSIHHHFNIDELYLELKKDQINISVSSIYRLIPFLIQGNFIRPIYLDDKNIYYEHICGHSHHDHLICANCNEIIEFCDEGIEVLQEHVAKKYNYQIVNHRLVIKGLCSKCQEEGGS